MQVVDLRGAELPAALVAIDANPAAPAQRDRIVRALQVQVPDGPVHR